MPYGENKTPFAGELIELMPRLRAFCRQITRDRSRADDLMQETIETALEAQNDFEMGTKMFSWLAKIASRLHKDSLKRASTRSPHQEIDDATVSRFDMFHVAPSQDASIEIEDVERAMRMLSEDHREILMLARNEMKYEEMASHLGLEVGTVKSKLNRARTELSTILRNAGTRKGGKAMMSRAEYKAVIDSTSGRSWPVSSAAALPSPEKPAEEESPHPPLLAAI